MELVLHGQWDAVQRASELAGARDCLVERVGIRNLKLPRWMRDDEVKGLLAKINRASTRLDGVRDFSRRVYNEEPIEVWTREGFKGVVGNIAGLKDQLPEALQKCLAFFPGVDRTQSGYEGLMAAQECLPNNDVRDRFAADLAG